MGSEHSWFLKVFRILFSGTKFQAMPLGMMDWIYDAEADYVIAAYGLAVLVLGGLLLVSWREARQTRAEWARVQEQKRQEPTL